MWYSCWQCDYCGLTRRTNPACSFLSWLALTVPKESIREGAFKQINSMKKHTAFRRMCDGVNNVHSPRSSSLSNWSLDIDGPAPIFFIWFLNRSVVVAQPLAGKFSLQRTDKERFKVFKLAFELQLQPTRWPHGFHGWVFAGEFYRWKDIEINWQWSEWSGSAGWALLPNSRFFNRLQSDNVDIVLYGDKTN